MKNSWKAVAPLLLRVSFVVLLGCTTPKPTAVTENPAEPEAIARTEFTERLENFFEYEPLHPGKPSQVRIHLTDLSDGSPVAQAEVLLKVRRHGATDAIGETKAKVAKVTGIYVAELNIAQAGDYDIEFHIKNAKLDERLPLSGFKVD